LDDSFVNGFSISGTLHSSGKDAVSMLTKEEADNYAIRSTLLNRSEEGERVRIGI